MRSLGYTFWQDGDYWLGFLDTYPDYMTQGTSLDASRSTCSTSTVTFPQVPSRPSVSTPSLKSREAPRSDPDLGVAGRGVHPSRPQAWSSPVIKELGPLDAKRPRAPNHHE